LLKNIDYGFLEYYKMMSFRYILLENIDTCYQRWFI